MRIAIGIAWLSLALSCRPSHPSTASGGLEVVPGAVHFEPVWLGGSKSAELSVHNGAPFTRYVELRSAAPFFTTPAAFDVPGGAVAKVTVRFAPVEAGPATGSLSLDDSDEQLAVPLDGAGLPVPACPAPGVCRTLSFDPQSGQCVDGAAADGLACSTACITGGTCQAGACAGQSISCDDGDRCTVDTCDPSSGCAHPPQACPQPEDPCHVGLCDPAQGCSIVAAPDGTQCGPSDCGVSQVCIGGSCAIRPTPDGTACGDSTPCRARGVCQGHLCLQPPATALQPVWSWQPTGRFVFPGVADAQGDLFWFEDDELVSVDRDGALRFRVRLSGAPRSPDFNAPYSQLILAAPEVLIANVGNWAPVGSSTLEARSTLDGSKLWSLSFADLSTALHAPSGEQGFAFMAISAQPGTGNFLTSTRANAGGAAWDSWVLGLDVFTGSLQWQVHFGYISGLVVDTAGGSYVYEDLWSHVLTALDASGGQRWSLMVSEPPALTFGSTLLTGYFAHLRDLTTGAVGTAFANPMFMDPLNAPLPVAKADWLVVPADNLICSTGLTFTDPRTGDLLGTQTLPCITDVMLTSRDTALVTTSSDLFELPRSTGPSWTCPLPGTAAPHAALLKGRVVIPTNVAIQAFDVPGVELEPSGWPCAGGSLGRGNTPR